MKVSAHCINLSVTIRTYQGQIESPAVGQIHLDEAVELLAHPLHAHQLLQWQIA